MFYGYLWNETPVEIQSYFIASVEMRGRKKQQRKQTSGQKEFQEKEGCPSSQACRVYGEGISGKSPSTKWLSRIKNIAKDHELG